MAILNQKEINRILKAVKALPPTFDGTVESFAAKVGCDKRTLRKYMKKEKIKFKFRTKRELSNEQIERVKQLHSEKKSARYIAKELEVSFLTVASVLKSANLTYNHVTPKPATKSLLKKVKELNEAGYYITDIAKEIKKSTVTTSLYIRRMGLTPNYKVNYKTITDEQFLLTQKLRADNNLQDAPTPVKAAKIRVPTPAKSKILKAHQLSEAKVQEIEIKEVLPPQRDGKIRLAHKKLLNQSETEQYTKSTYSKVNLEWKTMIQNSEIPVEEVLRRQCKINMKDDLYPVLLEAYKTGQALIIGNIAKSDPKLQNVLKYLLSVELASEKGGLYSIKAVNTLQNNLFSANIRKEMAPQKKTIRA